jgi:hypothetical protein
MPLLVFTVMSGYVAMMAGASVESKSKKQSLNTKSSTESEMVALLDMSSLVIWWTDFCYVKDMTLVLSKYNRTIPLA